MNSYCQSLDVARIQRDLRRSSRFGVVVRVWSRWGDPLLAGTLLALIVWAIVDGHTAQPAAGTARDALREQRLGVPGARVSQNEENGGRPAGSRMLEPHAQPFLFVASQADVALLVGWEGVGMGAPSAQG